MNVNKELNYLIGVSGGPDSIYLLEQLRIQNVKKIVVCHVNYNFRHDSAVDQKLVEQYCEKHNIKLETLNIRQNYQELKNNFESWAREARYNFFCEISEKYKIKNLLLGHNMNDFIETYLMQKQRNNFVKYFGIKKVTTYKNLLVIRPILNLKKSEIINWLNSNKIKYTIDSTNVDTTFLRNRIRENLNENDFEKYLKEINQANKQISIIIEQVEMYVKNNTNANELSINQQLQTASLEFIQRCIYQWFENEKKASLLHNRTNKTLTEIAKNIKTSTKTFWQINLNNETIFKDYNKLTIINNNLIKPKTFIIDSKNDLYKTEEFINWLEIYNAIKKDGSNFPYTISNSYDWYKTITQVGNKKTNRFFIDKKVSHTTRMVKAVVFNNEKRKILNKIR